MDLSTAQSESGMTERAHPIGQLSMNSNVPGCVSSKFVTNASNHVN